MKSPMTFKSIISDSSRNEKHKLLYSNLNQTREKRSSFEIENKLMSSTMESARKDSSARKSELATLTFFQTNTINPILSIKGRKNS